MHTARKKGTEDKKEGRLKERKDVKREERK
jgi:hypothetical protein